MYVASLPLHALLQVALGVLGLVLALVLALFLLGFRRGYRAARAQLQRRPSRPMALPPGSYGGE